MVPMGLRIRAIPLAECEAKAPELLFQGKNGGRGRRQLLIRPTVLKRGGHLAKPPRVATPPPCQGRGLVWE